MLGNRRPSLVAAALAGSLLTACTGTTTITAAEPVSAEPEPSVTIDGDVTNAPGGDTTVQPLDDANEGDTVDDANNNVPDAPATPTPDTSAATDAPSDTPGWTTYDVGSFTVDIPSEWITLTQARDIEEVIDDARANGAPIPNQALNNFRDMLENGNAVIGIDLAGDNVNAFRQFGPASGLVNHERLVFALEDEFAAFADNIAFESEPRIIGDTPGVLIRGRYDIEEQTAYMYQFVTHEGAYLYFFTVTFFNGDQPGLATELFRSIVID